MTGRSHHQRPTDEDRAFFEALVTLRGRYAARGDDDRRPVIGLHHVIAAVNAQMANAPHGRVQPGIAGN